MSIDETVAGWQTYMSPFVGKAKLLSPAVTNVRPPHRLKRGSSLTRFVACRVPILWASRTSRTSRPHARAAGTRWTPSRCTGTMRLRTPPTSRCARLSSALLSSFFDLSVFCRSTSSAPTRRFRRIFGSPSSRVAVPSPSSRLSSRKLLCVSFSPSFFSTFADSCLSVQPWMEEQDYILRYCTSFSSPNSD